MSAVHCATCRCGREMSVDELEAFAYKYKLDVEADDVHRRSVVSVGGVDYFARWGADT